LVLPRIGEPAACRLRTTVACTAGGSPRGSSSRPATGSLGAEEVLDRDGHAGERRVLAAAAAGASVGHPREGVELLGGRAVAVGGEDVARGELAGADALHGLRGGEREDVAHACGLGTSNPSSRTEGAASSIVSRGSEGRGSSARSAFVTGTTWEVGGTPSRSGR
jgi:hypothetical protein